MVFGRCIAFVDFIRTAVPTATILIVVRITVASIAEASFGRRGRRTNNSYGQRLLPAARVQADFDRSAACVLIDTQPHTC